MLNRFYHKKHFGIYAWVDAKTGKYLYIGSTTHNFYSRWIGHTQYQTNWRLKNFIDNGAVFRVIAAYPEEDKSFRTPYQLLEDEARLIKQHQPVANTQFRKLNFREQLDNDMKIGRISNRQYLEMFVPINQKGEMTK